MIQLGDMLKTLRQKNGLSQEQLARELGISRQAVSKWESNLAQPDLDNLAKLCEVFHTSADSLLGLNSAPQGSNAEAQRQSTPQSSGLNAGENRKVWGGLIFSGLILLGTYLLTLFRPELCLAQDSRILAMWEPAFWTNEHGRLIPLLVLSIAGIMCSGYYYIKK